MDASEMKQLLQSALAPDTAKVKAATAKLKQDYYKKPQSLGILLQILTDEDSSNDIKQLAATQALTLVPRHWNAVPEARKPQIREHVLQFTIDEQESKVRHQASRVVASIAKVDAEDGQWAELPELMGKISLSSDPKQREVGTYVLFSILETMGEESVSHFPALFSLFSKTIQDPESAEVRLNTLLALSRMGEDIDADNDAASLENFQKAVPAMLAVLKQSIDANDEDRALRAFGVFSELVEGEPRLLNRHFADLVGFMSEAASATNLEANVRTSALNFLTECVLYRKLKFQGLRIGDRMMELLFKILLETDEHSGEDEEHNLVMATLTMLAMMSQSLPPSQAIVPAIGTFKKYARSSHPRERQAALTVLATSVEGAPEFVETQIGELKPLLLQLLNDPELKVREAAVKATKELAECLPESLGKDHQSFMAALAKNLNAAIAGLEGSMPKTNSKIVEDCCNAIDGLVSGMKPKDLEVYLSELVPHLSELFSHSEIKIRAAAISAVGSVAEASGDAFQPYFEGTMRSLAPYVRGKETEEDLNMRALVTDAIGNLAAAVGPETFEQYVRPMMEASEEALNIDSPDLKESSYLFWGTIAKVYKEDFRPFLQGTVNTLFTCLEQKEFDIETDLEAEDLEESEIVVSGNKIKIRGKGQDGDDEVKDAEDEDDDDAWGEFTGISAIAEEKECALEALADIYSHTGPAFLPYFAKAIELILTLIDHPYDGLRRAAFSALYRAYGTSWQLAETEWEPGLPLKITPNSDIVKLAEVTMKTTLPVWSTDDDAEVIIEINRSLADTLKLSGPALISKQGALEQIVQVLVQVLTKKHACQVEVDGEEDPEDDEALESSEEAMWLIETAMDTVAGLAKALGTQFGELWKIFEKPILAYASASDANQRGAAVGAVADCIRGMGNAVTPFTPGLLRIILHRLADEDPQVKSNAAFAAGILVQYSDDDNHVLKAYPSILAKLEPLLQTQESNQLDNAAGCVARMIMKHPSNIPLPEVLPALVGLLPLKEDYEENEPVYRMIVALYQHGDATIQGLTARIVPVLQQVLGPPEEQIEDSDLRAQVQELLQRLRQ